MPQATPGRVLALKPSSVGAAVKRVLTGPTQGVWSVTSYSPLRGRVSVGPEPCTGWAGAAPQPPNATAAPIRSAAGTHEGEQEGDLFTGVIIALSNRRVPRHGL